MPWATREFGSKANKAAAERGNSSCEYSQDSRQVASATEQQIARRHSLANACDCLFSFSALQANLMRFPAMTHTFNHPDRLLRERQIIFGDPDANPPVPPLLPVSHSYFWALVKRGLLPPPTKLSARCSVWRLSDIANFIAQQGTQK